MRPAVTVLLAAWMIASTAWAQPGTPSPASPPPSAPPRIKLRFAYERGPGVVRCPEDHVVHDLLQGELGYDPVAPDADLRLLFSVSRQGRDQRVEILLRDADGTSLWSRELQGAESCTELVEVALVSAAIGILRVLHQRARAPDAGPPADRPPAVEPPPPSAPSPVVPGERPLAAPIQPAARVVDLRMGLDVVGTLGVTPVPALGGGVFVAARLRNTFSIEVAARGTWGLVASEQAGIRTRSSYIAGVLAACGHLRAAFLCPVVGLGVPVHQGGAQAVTSRAELFTVGARFGGEITFDDVVARGWLEVAGVPVATHISVADTTVWSTPTVVGSLGLGVAARIW